MAVHLRAIHSADHFRADVRAQARRVEDTTEQLRDELAGRLPLRWPLSKVPQAPTGKETQWADQRVHRQKESAPADHVAEKATA